MAITTTQTLSPPVQQAFNKMLLAVETPLLIHSLGAKRFRMNRASGTTMRFRRYSKLATAKVPLGPSAVTPPSASLSAVDIDAKIDFYGNWVQISDQVVLQAQDRELVQASELLGINLRETEDELVRDMMAASASVNACVNGVNGDNPTDITREDIDLTVRTLLGNDAMSIFENIEGQNKFGTAPVRNCFMALGHTDLSSDLNNVGGFTPVAQYPSQKAVLPSEYGSAGQMRFFLSSIGSVSPNSSANGNDVYNVFVIGREALGIVDQDGCYAQFIYHPSWVVGGPLELSSSAAWKTALVPQILNDQWIIRQTCTLSA